MEKYQLVLQKKAAAQLMYKCYKSNCANLKIYIHPSASIEMFNLAMDDSVKGDLILRTFYRDSL